MDAQQRAEYVERWARVLETHGEPRIAGRVYAQLVTADEPYLSLQQLAEQLGVSKASVSTNSRRLIELGMVSRVAVPGARGEHFAADPAGAQQMVVRAAQAARAMRELADEGLRMRPRAVTPGMQSLRVLEELYGELAASLERVAQGRHRRTRAGRRAGQ